MPSSNQRTEVVPEVVFLGKLVEHVADGKIRVPRFQRAFVWKQPDLSALLDSVLRGFPIGSILVWDTEKHIESTSRIGPVEISPRLEGQTGYLLDGQQRVSTLVGTLCLPDGVNDPIVEQIDWRIYYDLDGQHEPAFVDQRKLPKEPGGRYFPVRSLLYTAGFINACRRIEQQVDKHRAQKWLDEADRVSSAFRNYQLPLIHIREADLESAVTVFARLNRTGRKMAADELVSALTYQEGEFHLAHMLNEFKAELKRKGFGNLARVFLLRSVLAALERDIYAKDWADLMVKPEIREKLPEAFDAATRGIGLALKLLRILGVTSDRLLPYGLQLVLLGEFHRICPRPNAETVEVLKRWFWVTSFTGWFGGNAAQAKRALEEIRDIAKRKSERFSVVDPDMPAQPFPDRFDHRSARVRAFLLYLASLRPRALLRDATELELDALLSRLGTDAVGYVVSNPERRDLVSSPANRMFVGNDHDGQTLKTLKDLDDNALKQVLPTHGFPIDCIGLLRNGDRTGLIRKRLDALIAGERNFLQQRGVTPPVERTAPAIADSDASDDE